MACRSTKQRMNLHGYPMTPDGSAPHAPHNYAYCPLHAREYTRPKSRPTEGEDLKLCHRAAWRLAGGDLRLPGQGNWSALRDDYQELMHHVRVREVESSNRPRGLPSEPINARSREYC